MSAGSSESMIVGEIDVWADVVGQPEAVTQLRAAAAHPVHAYLFVGPRGSGKRAAARAFAAELLAQSSDADTGDERDRHRRLALAEQHPDLAVIEPEGTQFRGGSGPTQADTEGAQFQREAYRSPVECTRKIVVAVDFHTANPTAIGSLLKTLEEPPDTAVLVLLEEQVPPDQVTVASRCQRVDFVPVAPTAIRNRLVTEGIDVERAEEAAALAAGDLGRARLLATDERLHLRVQAWRDVPRRLDGRGATVADLVTELRALIDDAQEPLDVHQAVEVAEMAERIERYGERGSGARELDALHRRQRRALRLAELRLGLATLATVYRDELAVAERPAPYLMAVDAIHDAAEALIRNPNEELLLQALLLRLPSLTR